MIEVVKYRLEIIVLVNIYIYQSFVSYVIYNMQYMIYNIWYKYIYYCSLHMVFQLVQQWLSTDGKCKNPKVVHSTGLGVSVSLQYRSESWRSRLWRSGFSSKQEDKQTKCQGIFLPCSLYMLLWEGVPQI